MRRNIGYLEKEISLNTSNKLKSMNAKCSLMYQNSFFIAIKNFNNIIFILDCRRKQPGTYKALEEKTKHHFECQRCGKRLYVF